MPDFIYQRYTDNLLRGSVPTVQAGTAQTQYGPANLLDGNPAFPAKLAETSGAWKFVFAAPTLIDFVALIHHNLTAGLNVRWQGNAADAWGAPTLDQAITIPAWHEDGYSQNPWLDLQTLVPVAGNRTFQYWRLSITGVNAAPVALGELWASSPMRKLQAGPNGVTLRWGGKRTETRRIIKHETDLFAKLKYDMGVTIRKVNGDLDLLNTGVAEMVSTYRAQRGEFYPMVIVPDTGANDALMVDMSLPYFEQTRVHLGHNIQAVEFTELSRGLPL